MQSRNPADGSTVFDLPASSPAEVTAAIDAACAAQDPWHHTPLEQREQIVRAFAEHVAGRAESLAQLITREVGKLRADAAAEVAAVVAKAEITIEMMRGRRGDLDHEVRGVISQVRYRPLGVVVVLGPFNFPAHLPGGHIIPALLAGNTVVFKPSELAPAVGQWITHAWTEAGLPSGVLNLIQGDGEVAKTAIDDPRIAGVFFTGGYHTGKAIHRQLAGRPEVLLALEMGGNNPVILAPPFDTEAAVQTIATSAFISAGQRCTCARRLIVIDDANGQAAIDSLVELVGQMKPGLPLDPIAADVGPVVSPQAATRLLATQDAWLKAGGRARLQMTRSARCDALLTPGIVDMTDAKVLGDDEWFGPLLQIKRVADFAQAIEVAKATRFGLASGLVGGTQAMFDELRQSLAVGILNWNLPTTGASSRLPFGGVGQSGNHRPAGSFAIDFCNDPVASMIQSTHPQANDGD
jgi:succinylglutamic semialdehyde dehydrogenase